MGSHSLAKPSPLPPGSSGGLGKGGALPYPSIASTSSQERPCGMGSLPLAQISKGCLGLTGPSVPLHSGLSCSLVPPPDAARLFCPGLSHWHNTYRPLIHNSSFPIAAHVLLSPPLLRLWAFNLVLPDAPIPDHTLGRNRLFSLPIIASYIPCNTGHYICFLSAAFEHPNKFSPKILLTGYFSDLYHRRNPASFGSERHRPPASHSNLCMWPSGLHLRPRGLRTVNPPGSQHSTYSLDAGLPSNLLLITINYHPLTPEHSPPQPCSLNQHSYRFMELLSREKVACTPLADKATPPLPAPRPFPWEPDFLGPLVSLHTQPAQPHQTQAMSGSQPFSQPHLHLEPERFSKFSEQL